MEAQGTVDQNNRGVIGLLRVFAFIAILGALNWGLVGFFNYNLVDAAFGNGAVEHTHGVSRVLYALIGLAGLGALLLLPALRRSSVGPEQTRAPRWIQH
jgi:uncharacterized membrane protein YuzA (DUF378 family)